MHVHDRPLTGRAAHTSIHHRTRRLWAHIQPKCGKCACHTIRKLPLLCSFQAPTEKRPKVTDDSKTEQKFKDYLGFGFSFAKGSLTKNLLVCEKSLRASWKISKEVKDALKHCTAHVRRIQTLTVKVSRTKRNMITLALASKTLDRMG